MQPLSAGSAFLLRLGPAARAVGLGLDGRQPAPCDGQATQPQKRKSCVL
jgi:hypothetical protein